MKKYKEVTLTLKENNKVKFSSKNCEDAHEQLELLMNGLMLYLLNIKLHNKVSYIDMEKYYVKLLDDLRKGVCILEEEFILTNLKTTIDKGE